MTHRQGVTKKHRDDHNCDIPGYDGTGVYCTSLVVDGNKEVWSLKFIANSRKSCQLNRYKKFDAVRLMNACARALAISTQSPNSIAKISNLTSMVKMHMLSEMNCFLMTAYVGEMSMSKEWIAKK